MENIKIVSFEFVIFYILFLFVCCYSCKSSHANVIQLEADKNLYCFQKNDLYSIDSTHIKNVLIKISLVREVDDFSKLHDDTISYCIVDYNYKNKGVCKIVVGLDFQTHFSTQFVFYANKNDDSIKILEVVRDTIMTIEEWRNASWLK